MRTIWSVDGVSGRSDAGIEWNARGHQGIVKSESVCTCSKQRFKIVHGRDFAYLTFEHKLRREVSLTSKYWRLLSSIASHLRFGLFVQHLPLNLVHIHIVLPPKLLQARFSFLPFVRAPLQTPPSDVAVDLDIRDQRFLAHVVVFGAYISQHEEVQARTVEVFVEFVQNVDLDAASLVGVEGIVANAEDGGENFWFG